MPTDALPYLFPPWVASAFPLLQGPTGLPLLPQPRDNQFFLERSPSLSFQSLPSHSLFSHKPILNQFRFSEQKSWGILLSSALTHSFPEAIKHQTCHPPAWKEKGKNKINVSQYFLNTSIQETLTTCSIHQACPFRNIPAHSERW